jgi:scyllo-inositol 2-dehydrogenase (NADP+)|tara:strand:- start:3382 stop:4437 length:1056 start_codon:yes stop_codon:yes gene_type:complete
MELDMNPIRTALAAYGLSGKIFHAPFLIANPAFELVAVVERSKSESAALIPAPQIVRSFDALLSDDSIELVVVNSPSGLHFDMAKKALHAGKHVVVEKPFTATTAEARQLINLAAEQQLLLTVYHNRRLESGFLTVQKLLQEGSLGKISQFHTCVDRYRPQLGSKLWKETANPAAGLLYDFGSHMIDEALMLFGRPQRIFADIRCQRVGATASDYFILRFDYNNPLGDFCAEMRASMVAQAPSPHYIIHGHNGSYVKNSSDIQERLLQTGVKPLTAQWCAESQVDWGKLYQAGDVTSCVSVNGRYTDFYDNIAAVLLRGESLIVDPEQAFEVIELLEIAQHSAAQGCVIKL